MSHRYQTILLFGAPGAGKGTQGKVLGTVPRFFHCACGDVFRALDTRTALGQEFVKYSSRGELVPDELTIRLWNARMDSLRESHAYKPDIDFLNEQILYPYSLSNTEDNRLPLRFAGLLHNNVKASICASSGIFSGYDVIKMILAGADAVQVVSTLYLNQTSVIGSMLKEIEKWMNEKGYETLSQFRGKLSKSSLEDNLPYHRTQYIDFRMSTTAILKKYKAIV